MRLRLRCSSAYALGDLQWCIIAVPEHARTVRDLANHVSRLLELNLRGGDGDTPLLFLSGFLVAEDDAVSDILLDDEVLDVAPRSAASTGGLMALPAPREVATPEAPKRRALEPGSTAGDPPGKRPRPGHSPVMQPIGWQSPETPAAAAAAEASAGNRAAAAPAALPAAADKPQDSGAAASGGGGGATGKTKAKAKAAGPKPRTQKPESSSEDEEDESEEEAPATSSAPAAADGAAKAASAQAAAAQAQAAAMATCTNGGRLQGEEAEAEAGEDGEGRGIFVGGLPYSLDNAQLQKHFEQFGAVAEATVVMNVHTGKSKGFGFVEFANAKGREKALAEGQNQEIWGKRVEVKPRQSRGPKGGKDGKGGKGDKGGKGGKGKDVKGQGNKGGKGGKGGKDGKAGKAGKPTPKLAKVAESSSSEEDDGDEGGAAPAAAAAPAVATAAEVPAAEAAAGPVVKAKAAGTAAMDEEAELQRQMAALGLPVSFTASEKPGGDESGEDEEAEEE